MLEILEPLKALGSEVVFEGQKRHRPLSNMAMLMLLRRMKVEGVTVHGFRSTFRDWAAEVAKAPREVAEMSLAHKVGSDVERAYARSDLLDRRRSLMERWSRFVTGGEGKVISLTTDCHSCPKSKGRKGLRSDPFRLKGSAGRVHQPVAIEMPKAAGMAPF